MPRKRIEFSLTRLQAIVLSTGGILALFLSFIIGMLVGKEMEGLSILERDVKSQIVKMKIEPMPVPQTLAPSGGAESSAVMKNVTSKPVITFYDTLSTGKKERAPIASKVPDEDKKESSRKAYTIQVGAMKDKTLADRMVSKLKKSGYTAYISESSGNWYKVRLGTFYNKDDAKKEAAKIKRTQGLPSTVVEK